MQRFGRTWRTGVLAATIAAGLGTVASAQAPAREDPWPSLAENAFNGRPIEDGAGVLALDMPARADDAALVPVTVRSTLPPGDERRVTAFTLVIDENPAPVAATFSIGANSAVSSISTRVRVDTYTNVHAVAELGDGRLYMVKTYVKASGGCAAPAAKSAEEAKANAGQMRFRQFSGEPGVPVGRMREAQVMIRHPNNSGLQMDQLTRHYIPAFFVRDIKVWQGDELVWAMEGGISISEDPNIRFNYLPNGARSFRVEAVDTDNRVYRDEWPIEAAPM
jgi:sulfur-oxidizing protein SoxY